MTDSFQSRLKEVAKENGGNRALCEKSGVSERTFANWLSGASEPKIIGLAAIAQAAGVTIDWIVNGSKPKRLLGVRQHDQSDVVRIPWLSRKLTSPSTDCLTHKLDQLLNVESHLPFSADFLQERVRRSNFDQLCILDILGDALHPTANDGDIVLIDRTDTELADGLIAFVFKGIISVKRIVNQVNEVTVISDNASLYPAYTITANDLDQLHVIGRVIWIGKTVL